MRRRDHAVEGAERIEHAVIAGEAAHRAVLGCIQRDRTPVAGAVEHRDGDGLVRIGERRCRERKPCMIVVMRHADQRHARGKSKLLAENLRRAGHLFEAAAVEAGRFGVAQQFYALRRFFQHRASQCPEQGRVIPGRHPRGDVADIAPHAPQRRDHRLDRRLRIFGGVLVAGKPLFLVVDDQARSIGRRHLDQRDAGIMRAGWSEPGQIHRFAARQPRANQCDPLAGKVRVKLVKARGRQQPRGKPSRGVKAGGAEARILGTNSLVRHLQRWPKRCACEASIILGGGQQRLFRAAEYSAACAGACGLRQSRQSKTILGRERCRSVRHVMLA